jgi:hypothetical protein
MKTATKPKAPEQYGDQFPITAFQKKRIMRNCDYREDIKSEWVQWATEDNSKVHLRDLNQEQAKRIIMAQEGGNVVTDENWALFDQKNRQHVYILSLCRQLNWTKTNEKWGEVADLDRLSNWLKSGRSPVIKPLRKMTAAELSKIIKALESMTIKNYTK